MSQGLLSTLGDELLDHPDADPEAVALSLGNIALANRWLGGWWAVRRGLARILEQTPPADRRVTLLDVGCGMGDIARRAVGWAKPRGIEIVPIGIERHRRAAALARGQALAPLLACVSALPIRARSVDLVLASQLVHHLTPDACVEFCQAADRVARRGVIIADLRRSRWAKAGFVLASRALRFDPATCADGLTSIARGFRPGELRALLARAGVRGEVRRSPGFRLVATWTPEATT
jgi:SAM-dependent methyltransferase